MTVIKLDHITKIYGHANLRLKIDKGKVSKAEMNIFESARFFEAILKGRKYSDAAMLTSRICGICSSAHTLAALKAVENAFGIQPNDYTVDLRKLLQLGGIIQSHALHMYFMALPDYLGLQDAVELAKKDPAKIDAALKLKKTGNDLVRVIGARAIHPVTPRIGGFSSVPSRSQLQEIRYGLQEARDIAVDTCVLFGDLYETFKFKRFTQYVCLADPLEYAFYDGELCSSEAKTCTGDYRQYIKESIRPYATSKFALFNGKHYALGPLARINLQKSKLNKTALSFAKRFPAHSPFSANLARAVEVLHCIEEAIDLLDTLDYSQAKAALKTPEIKPAKTQRGVGVIEAPRGTLFHDYQINEKGLITKANVITPTAQFLGNVEEDVKLMVPPLLEGSKDELIQKLEVLVRSYDPCISCATHFLDVTID
ncbi:MAG: Ni/Fe hydrogenase subunit alpha [Candidatus Micrarchaeota archaeon]